ncbi:hypothetical protein V494_08187 [Pseudogymnoascus sp. VKM F-4513 (FW-928)]|nr:hypothetical protein V494_08187 [Pseudogymnoascus sp. VKM F-4513 (FW-928)]
MKISLAISLFVALASAAAVPGTSHEIERIPVPEGFFESHIGDVGFTVEPATPAPIGARAITHFYACLNADFQPACTNFEVNTGGCYNFNGNWNDAISSIGPDQGTTCILWYDAGCSGRSVVNIINPGIWNLGDFNFNDVASSVRCD